MFHSYENDLTNEDLIAVVSFGGSRNEMVYLRRQIAQRGSVSVHFLLEVLLEDTRSEVC